MTGGLFYQVVDLLSDVILLAVLEFHAAKLIVDSLNNDLSSLIKLLATLLFALFASIFNELHKLFFLKFP